MERSKGSMNRSTALTVKSATEFLFPLAFAFISFVICILNIYSA